MAATWRFHRVYIGLRGFRAVVARHISQSRHLLTWEGVWTTGPAHRKVRDRSVFVPTVSPVVLIFLFRRFAGADKHWEDLTAGDVTTDRVNSGRTLRREAQCI